MDGKAAYRKRRKAKEDAISLQKGEILIFYSSETQESSVGQKDSEAIGHDVVASTSIPSSNRAVRGKLSGPSSQVLCASEGHITVAADY